MHKLICDTAPSQPHRAGIQDRNPAWCIKSQQPAQPGHLMFRTQGRDTSHFCRTSPEGRPLLYRERSLAASVVAEWPRLFNGEEMFLSLSWKSLKSMEEEILKDGS